MTGLANRVALRDRLSQALALLERQPGQIALLFIDLDNFKTINDSFGHETGDKVLVEVARRLTGVARRSDTVARLGGDEFVMLCTALRDDDDPRLFGDRVVRAVAHPYIENDVDLTVTASVGIVLTGDPVADPGQLLQDADIAMYRAKDAGKNCFQVFSPPSGPGSSPTTSSRWSCARPSRRPSSSSSTSRSSRSRTAACAASRPSCAGTTRPGGSSRRSSSCPSPRSAASSPGSTRSFSTRPAASSPPGSPRGLG